MPTYLCHGFRWQRRSIRVYVVVQNLDDAAPEWIIRRGTARTLLESFYALFDFLPLCAPAAPAAGTNGRARSQSRPRRKSASSSSGAPQLPLPAPVMAGTVAPPPPPRTVQQARDEADDVLSQDWSAVRLLEEYDPLDLTAVSRPHAYVADYVARVDLSEPILDHIARYEDRLRTDPDPPVTADETARRTHQQGGKKSAAAKRQGQGWFEKLRDQLQRGEEIRWYVVVNGDEERSWPDENLTPVTTTSATTATATAHEAGGGVRQQQEHHAQYMLQQQIFEGADRDKDRARERLRLELSGDKDILRDDGDNYAGGSSRKKRSGRDPRPVPLPPPVPNRELPSLRGQMSMDSDLRQQQPPKTPRTAGFRRLFSRSKSGGMSP